MPHIRAVTPDDLTALLPMIAALARHHGDTPGFSAAALSRDLFGPDRCLSGLIARDGGGVTG